MSVVPINYKDRRNQSVQLSHVRLFATPWTVAYQAPLSMGFSRQEYWSGLPFPSPGDLPDPGIEPRSPALEADALNSEPPGKPLRMFNYKIENRMIRDKIIQRFSKAAVFLYLIIYNSKPNYGMLHICIFKF